MSIVTINSRSLGEISYEDTEYKIETYSIDGRLVSCLRYIGESDKPTQPVGLSDYSFIFSNRKDIETLDLSHWDMSEAENLNGMFCDCISLKDISSISGWDVSNVEDMSKLFRNCYRLNDISYLKDWDMSKVTNNDYMFAGCENISIYDILVMCDNKFFRYIYPHNYEENINKLELSTVYGRFGKVPKELNSYAAKLLCSGDRGRNPSIDDIEKTMSNTNVIINFGNSEDDITKIISESVANKLLSEGVTKIYIPPLNPDHDECTILVEVPDRLDGDHIVSLMERCFTNLSEMKQEEEIKPDTRYRRPRKNEKHYF